MNLRTTACLWALLMAAGGCGGKYGRTVPNDMVNTLTYENKIDLVEAENDLFVAYDKVDEAENEILRTRIRSAAPRSPSRWPTTRSARPRTRPPRTWPSWPATRRRPASTTSAHGRTSTSATVRSMSLTGPAPWPATSSPGSRRCAR